MRIKLAYGKTGLWVNLPEGNVTVVQPEYVPGLPDESEAIRDALRSPIGAESLRAMVNPRHTVAIVFSDITRPQPRDRMLPVLLEEIAHAPRQQVVLINALGTHRSNTTEELAAMLGPDVAANYRILQHDAWDRENLVPLGKTSFGHEVYVNKTYMKANVRILTGFIEPHFFAGFSGGPKSVLPGLTDHASTMANHSAEMLSSPRATWGVTDGNPVWEEMREVALKTGPAFLLNVSLNRDRDITGVFAGDMLEAHAAGVEFVKRSALASVSEPFDIVIASNSGYPLDLNLYQAVKGMSAAAQVVKPGGSIIVAAECWDGIPDHGEYGRLLKSASSPEQLLARIRAPGFACQDQWEAQIQAQVQMKADVYVKSSHLDAETIESALLRPCTTVEETVAVLLGRYGPDARICVLPEGPMTIPCLAAGDGG